VESLLQQIIELLTAVGPEVVFVVTLAETAFFIGLLIPAEATVLVAGFMAYRGVFELQEVLAATLLGAFAGDQIGYLLGRFGGARAAAHGGRAGRMWQRYEPRATALFRRHAVLAVTCARFISFVRTLMPWFAGMTRVPYPRFAFFDALGVTGWGVASVLVGYAAGESWHQVADTIGTTSTILVVVIALALWVYLKRRRVPPAPAPDPVAPDPPIRETPDVPA
jgi:undecaprenyl-diphosphatase